MSLNITRSATLAVALALSVTAALPARAGDKKADAAKDKAKEKAKDKTEELKGKGDDAKGGDDKNAAAPGAADPAKLAHENEKHDRRIAMITRLDQIATDNKNADLATKAKDLRTKEDARHERALARINGGGDDHGKAGEDHGKAGEDHGKAGEDHGKGKDAAHGKDGEHGKGKPGDKKGGGK